MLYIRPCSCRQFGQLEQENQQSHEQENIALIEEDSPGIAQTDRCPSHWESDRAVLLGQRNFFLLTKVLILLLKTPKSSAKTRPV